MTREEAKELVTHSTMEANEVYNIIDQILNDHEAQLKEANRIKEVFRKLSLELDTEASELRAQLKAKEEEIEILKTEKLRLEEECYKYHFKINKTLKDNQWHQ